LHNFHVRNKRTLLTCAACALLAVFAFLAFKPSAPEPSYGGHPLSYWVRILGSERSTEHERQMASEAVDHIGAAAAPFLVQWIQYRPTKGTELQKKLADLIFKSRYGFALRIGRSIYYTKGELLAWGACQAFRVLGTKAAPELDELCRVMNDLSAPPDPRGGGSSVDRATYCLSWLGTNALPALTAVIQNPQRARWQALNSIRLMEQHQRTAQFPITAIIGCLEDTNDPNVSSTAAQILFDLNVAPELCLPALVAGLRSKSVYTRATSADSLGRYRERAASAIPALTNATSDLDPRVRFSVTNALHAIAPGTYTNVSPWRGEE
jgi:hypothetical protein